MTATTRERTQALDILIDELQADDELRAAFFHNPYRTLRQAGEWGLALTDSELRALSSPQFPVWERVAETLEERLLQAA